MGKGAIVITNGAKSFRNKKVLTDINVSIREAEIFGLVGPSGAGKTTLVKCIAGISALSQGEAIVLGNTIPSLSVMKEIGYMAQSDALYHELTGKENLQFFTSLYGGSSVRKRKRMKRAIEVVNLEDDMSKIVSHYSGGMKRRLSLAIALAHTPRLLILDEPTVGIDPLLRRQVWEELRRLQLIGTTIVLTTHVMDEAEKCDRLGLIYNGRLLAVGTPEQLKMKTKAATIEEAFLILSKKL